MTLIHELQHALSWVNDDASNLQYSNNFLGNKSDVRRKYEEAAAISMYNTVSDELGLGIQDVFTRNRVKIGDMIRRVPTFVYGSFPEEYTNGMVTIPSEFSSDLAQRYRNRYNERRK